MTVETATIAGTFTEDGVDNEVLGTLNPGAEALYYIENIELRVTGKGGNSNAKSVGVKVEIQESGSGNRLNFYQDVTDSERQSQTAIGRYVDSAHAVEVRERDDNDGSTVTYAVNIRRVL